MKRERFLELLQATLKEFEKGGCKGICRAMWYVSSSMYEDTRYMRVIMRVRDEVEAFSRYNIVDKRLPWWWEQSPEGRNHRILFLRGLIEHVEKGTLPALETLLS